MLEDKIKRKPENPEQITTETKTEIKEDVKSDKFTPEERKEIAKIVKDDVLYGEQVQEDYVTQKELDLKHYHGVRPSELEGLTKKAWMSDRNLGLARAVADSYQATLLATCWNPDSINFTITRVNDIDNRNNQEKFTKWGMGKNEANTQPEVDSFIHNRIVCGTSFFKIYRKRWSEWIDKRIPIKNSAGATIRYAVKTEKVDFEKGIIENISDIDDILMPEYGRNIQELPFFIHILRLDGETVLDYLDRKVLVPLDVESYKKKLYANAFEDKKSTLGEEKMKAIGLTSPDSITDLDIRRLPITLYEWYGYYTKNGRKEKFRFIVDTINDEFLSGKPLRKINRSGKIPFAGGGLAKEPGHIRGIGLLQIVAPIINAFNNIFNQKSDFQYVTNCPFGFFTPEEGYQQQKYELEPMICYPVDGEPGKSVYFPNLSRSMAWAESDMRILFEVLERLTGAASYFSVGKQRNATLGQDMLVDKQSETRFGLWVSRIINDITEAVGMWFELYQDYPVPGLAERIVGEGGSKIFPNLSIDSLRGDTAVQMTPDAVAGSKAYRKQLQLWAFQAGQQTIWMNPQINPQGNWNLVADTFKELMGMSDNEVIRYLGEKPKGQYDEAELKNEWIRFMNGEDFEPPEKDTALSMQHLTGHMKQKEEQYHLLDEEYRPNFDSHLFKTMVNYMKFIRNMQQERIADSLASNAIMMQGQMAPGAQPVQAPQSMQAPENMAMPVMAPQAGM